MKQVQFTFADDRALEQELRKLRQWVRSNLCSSLMIQLYTELLDRPLIESVCATIQAQLPEAVVVGCSSNGNIINGDFSGGCFAAVCTLFEYPSTKLEVLQYPLSAQSQAEVAEALCEEVRRRPWVKGVEMLVTIRGLSVTPLCAGLSALPEDVQVFGGGAFCENLEANDACVFSSVGGYMEKGILFVLLGGEDFHVKSTFVTGWEPLGQPLDVTAAEGANLLELNGLPAYETYNRYLNIPNDENFFFNTLEFPFLYRLNGIDIMRAPLTSNPDGSLTMTADIDQGVSARIAYGDPWTILNTVWQQSNELLAYAPECIVVFSCAGRRTFWGNAEIGKETEAYQIVAPTSGFYTTGEFLRTKGFVNQHNVTQVIAAMREGEAQPRPEQELRMAEHSFEGKVSMINRMATFIKVTTAELAEANRKLQEANHLLSELSVTDALTGIGNRTAYLDRTRHLDVLIQEGRAVFCVAAFDLNGLKTINDNYGHECGDMALIDAAEQLIEVFGRGDLYRVGGDEFLAVLERCSGEEMARLFTRLEESLRKANQTEKPYKLPLAISKGYAVFLPGEDSEYSTVARRADGAMYRDKAEYYRTHDRRRR